MNNWIRALGGIIPALIMGSFYFANESGVWFVVGIIITYIVAMIVLQIFKIKNLWGYTLLTTIVSGYFCAIIRTSLEMTAQSESAATHAGGVIFAAGILTLASLAFILPAWIVYLVIDAVLVKAKNNMSK